MACKYKITCHDQSKNPDKCHRIDKHTLLKLLKSGQYLNDIVMISQGRFHDLFDDIVKIILTMFFHAVSISSMASRR